MRAHGVLVIANADAPEALRGIMVRKEPKGCGGRKTNNPRAWKVPPSPAEAAIVVLEDVTTTGGSAVKAVARLRAETDCDVVGVISILDRQEGGAEAFCCGHPSRACSCARTS